MKTILITGSSGFIGKNFIDFLSKKGKYKIVCLQRNKNLNQTSNQNNLFFENFDDTNRKSKIHHTLIKYRPDVIFHLAASSVPETLENFSELIDVNFNFGIEIISTLLSLKLFHIKFIFTSSYWQYLKSEEIYLANPIYISSKKIFTESLRQVFQTYDLRVIEIVLYDVYGPNDHRGKVLNSFALAVKNQNSSFDFTSGTNAINFVYIEDVLNAFEKAIELNINHYEAFGVMSKTLNKNESLKKQILKLQKDLDLKINLNFTKSIAQKTNNKKLPVFKNIPNWSSNYTLSRGFLAILDDLKAKKQIIKNLKTISICIPVLNEEENILNTYKSIKSYFKKNIKNYVYEIIFTDNNSSDKSWKIIKEISNNDFNVKAIRFNKNIGYQESILCNLLSSSGDASIQLDCDLQDPISLFAQFILHYEKGYDVVYGIRKDRHENFLLKIIRRFYYYLIDVSSDYHIPQNVGDYRLISRRVIDSLMSNISRPLYIRGSIAMMGFKSIGINYTRNQRLYGKSKFNFFRLITFSFRGFLTHTTFPLTISAFFSFVFSLISIIMLILLVFYKFQQNSWPPGWALSVFVSILSIAIITMLLSIIGIYIEKIIENQNNSTFGGFDESLNLNNNILNNKLKGILIDVRSE